MCSFCDGTRHAYSIAQLEKHSKTKNKLVQRNDSDNSDSDFEVNDGMEEEDNEAEDSDMAVDNTSDVDGDNAVE